MQKLNKHLKKKKQKRKKMKKKLNNEFQEVIDFLKSLPEGRRVYIEMSGIWIEVTKEEAINYLKSKINEKEA
ncbi:TPA: hypothetical protein HA335_03320 [Methanocaldococcus jannaschii]|uniref:Uncharacterized protein MJ0647 n=3 Tax=Methanocaldococcus jannaschii TaxID=2190 RepID=Y647_METJA|nr:RecName: Full=Uncharacterized protein MJ0647 [Methanocaldococcus jannaschii DSM 2661]AAB98645.1 hypothetical protein MJ_0647 [Methanocaldococcus jannaschii DSM 2661]HII59601.1 hypothetical protein [Methanocaldococcus jannaschii]